RQHTAFAWTLLNDKGDEVLLHPSRPRRADQGDVRGCAAVSFAALDAEIDFACRAVTRDVFDFEIQNLGNQGAEHIADTAGAALAKTRWSLSRAHILDAGKRRVFAAGDHHRRAVEAADPIKLAKVELDLGTADHLIQIVGAI